MTSGGARRVLVTGANGFVGRALSARLATTAGWRVSGAVRTPDRLVANGVDAAVVGPLSDATRWAEALRGVHVVVHTAARVHVMRDHAHDALDAFRAVNVHASAQLARSAALAGVSRLVYVSSIKVNGEESQAGRPFRYDDAPRPEDPYGVSKAEAETTLRQIGNETGLEIVIVRPPLVYGPGVRANFAAMMRVVQRGIPLPFGAVRNARSLVSLENLCDLLIRCADHPRAPGGVFLASDGVDLSTPELLRGVGQALGRPARLVAVPPALLYLAGAITGTRAHIKRLCGTLQVDIAPTAERLQWTPPQSVDAALAAAAAPLRS